MIYTDGVSMEVSTTDGAALVEAGLLEPHPGAGHDGIRATDYRLTAEAAWEEIDEELRNRTAPARALRALQKFDLVTKSEHRTLLIEAMDALGEELGLECGGEDEGDGQYSHNDGTCPIHEWLVPRDYRDMADTLEAGDS